MTVRKSNCMRNYHTLAGIKLEKRLEDTKTGVFGNIAVFTIPPATMIVVAALLLDYANKRVLWEQGGIAQKLAYTNAVKAVIAMLDTFADYVDELADGNITIIKMAGYTATYDPNGGNLPKPGIVRIDGVSLIRLVNSPGVLESDNGTLPKGTTVIGILTEGGPLPDNTIIDSDFNILIPGTYTLNFRVNIGRNRKKIWRNLKNSVTYYVYHIAVTSKVVSQLSVVVSEQCF